VSGLHPIVVCGRCRRTGPGRLATSTLPDLCRSCLAYERKLKTRCRVCGTVTVKRVRPGHDGDLCDDCVPGKRERVCGICGRMGRLAVRATATSPAIGDCCYRPPVAICSQCGREQPCYHARDPQRAICLACASRRTTIVTCLDCGTPRAAHRCVEGGAICETCDRRRGNTIGVCTGCGRRAPLRRDRCDRCRLRATVDELSDAGDPAAVAALARFLDWMAAARNPTSMLRWMQTPTFWVTRGLTSGGIEVSHAGLDAVAPVAPQAVGFVRAQLVGCGVLEARDEPSAAFAAWHATALERIAPGRDRAHVRAYATWQVAHQLARTSQSGRPTVSAQKYARSLVSEAIKLTCWLHDQELELRHLRQDLLDAWIADGPGIRRRARLFTAWLQRADITVALHVDWLYDFQQRPPLQDEQRFAALRRLLHDHDIGLRERFAGSLLLLYAQPLTRIVQLRTSGIMTADSGEIAITLARGAIVLPEPLASTALALRYQRISDGEVDGWLLPGRKPGTHITAEHLRKRLAPYGVPSRPGRHGALLALAGRLPAPILAERLGIHQARAAQWVRAAGATYSDYVALRITPDAGSVL
jgi:hypothetical protein